ncbi:MAG TPA: toll/interleukin-1 receptor domain-containing protein [Bryobacteraceae bacterium]|nr:toll/interleukin-1 receptor domain-containing protein [Bryobacteraceae bacterium]
MKHIFVSHAGADSTVADRLAPDLKKRRSRYKVDTRELGLGDDSIAFMNPSIGDAHTVIILYSQHTQKAHGKDSKSMPLFGTKSPKEEGHAS